MALIFSVLTLLGASIVYWVLMSNFMFHTVDFIHQAIVTDGSPFESNNQSDGKPEWIFVFEKLSVNVYSHTTEYFVYSLLSS